MPILTPEEFVREYDTEEFNALTGLLPDTFIIIFNKYCGPGTVIKKPIYLFWLFKYYKLYPISRALSTIHHRRYKSRKSFEYRLHGWEVRINKTCGCLL